MRPYGDIPHFAFVDNSLHFFHGIVLVHSGFPAPDAPSRRPNLYGVRVFTQSSTDGFAEIPWTVDAFGPGMPLLIQFARYMMGITVTTGRTKTQSGRHDTRSLHYTSFDHIADVDTETGNLAHRGQPGLQAFMSLLNGDNRFLIVMFHDPIGIAVRQITGKMKMGVDQTRHDAFARDIPDFVIGRYAFSPGTRVSIE